MSSLIYKRIEDFIGIILLLVAGLLVVNTHVWSTRVLYVICITLIDASKSVFILCY